MFKAWFPSCSWCIWAEAGERAPPRQVHNDGITTPEDITVCHDQPRPVAPMKLVLYDNIPSSPRVDSRASLLPTFVTEGRSLASRASNRASLFLKNNNRRPSPRKLTISGPTDFRHLTPGNAPRRRRRSFRPLELSIYVPGNQLPDLPVFENFGLDNFDLDSFGQDNNSSCQTPTPPPKAVCPRDRRDERQLSDPSPSIPFAVARKPVGAPSVRNSLYIEIHDRRHTMPHPEKVQTTQPSVSPPRRSCETLDSHLHASLDDLVALKHAEMQTPPPCLDSPSRENHSRTSTPTYHHHTRSRTIVDWFAAKSYNNQESYHNRAASSSRFWMPQSRARTLSGSTMVSLANASTAGFSSRNPSLSSSVIMSTNTQSPLTFHAVTEKDYEAYDATTNYKLPTQETCPTVYERNRPKFRPGKELYHSQPLGANDIGVAF
ncbi:uncharacterized protein GIQ15_02315 [Arthroderma uncinatum]|uniref:uncharacterized protein n=1 Tax=Arthroderma uncinatum TaxID=74035 RepID=UPI00144A991E|nr:uncharacterized protein GIQ15_02315 [Arthroderma uncinatum]KAF3482991.1 hypothetical protein GIQ15_02315 [Arthroderma uncinatum]